MEEKGRKKARAMAAALSAAAVICGMVCGTAEASAAEWEAPEIRSRGNMEFTGKGRGEPDGVFAVSDLYALWNDFQTCRETAEATRRPMVDALALKGVEVPADASYAEIAEGILRIPDEYVWGTGDAPGVSYDYHNHVDREGKRTNDTANSAVLPAAGGCYTTPVYHTHTGNASSYGGCYTTPVYHGHTGNASSYGGCYTIPVYHGHTGNASSYGGCYTIPVYHGHAGNASSYGGCYTTPVYHTHTGSTSSYGGCYTTPVYHSHTGSPEQGGGCYTTPVYHTHTAECPREERTCSYRRDQWYREGTHDNTCYYHGECTHFEDMVKTYGHSCGRPDGDTERYSYCSACGFKEETSHKYYAYTCGAEEGVTVDHWETGCGKDGTTVESYGLGCGKDGTTVESYKLGCGKDGTTVESYKLGCGKTTTSTEGYTVGCNHVEEQIVAAHMVFGRKENGNGG